jgi:tagaturonate reductase
MLKPLNRTTARKPQLYPVKVLQFGEGNFLRAFADWIIDLMNERGAFNGAVQVVQPIAQGMGDAVNRQDGLYHLVLNGIQQGKAVREIRLITCVTGVINPFQELSSYLKAAENPDLKFIISNTTEAGIIFSSADTDPKTLPQTFPGKLTLFLHHRYQHFKGAADKALIVMPCELIEKNGEALRSAIIQYVDHWNLEAGFRTWILAQTMFCNTLVDRIVPGFPKDTIGDIQTETGYDDTLVVMAEPFHLWVIEASDKVQKLFPAEKAGLQVKFVKDLTPYRTRKVRILNGAHTAMVPVAYLQGLRTVREAIDDVTVGEFVKKIIKEEIIPTLDLSAEELKQFAHDVMERFQNPFIRHELLSIALNSVSKYQVRVLPSVLEYINRKGKLPEGLLYSLAALIRFYKGEWNGETIPLNDTPQVMEFFKNAWNNEKTVVQKVLANKDFWGMDLTAIDGLADEVQRQLIGIETRTYPRHLK